MTARNTELKHWLSQQLHTTEIQLQSLNGDASFRRYFRLPLANQSFIVMDAPPEHENCEPFVRIAQWLAQADILVPDIKAQDIERGFLVLSDFGDEWLWHGLQSADPDLLYRQAIDVLVRMQVALQAHARELPAFDGAFIRLECQRYPDWYLARDLTVSEQQLFDRCLTRLMDVAEEQPQVFVHRDYHSRNIMRCANGQLGIIDFQDAVYGPITYDLVSLLKDCYISWPLDQVQTWVEYYYQQAKQAQLLSHQSFEQVWQWFEWQGIQRHIKVMGIFARLAKRDGKPQFLQDIPQAQRYLKDAFSRYPEFQAILDFA